MWLGRSSIASPGREIQEARLAMNPSFLYACCRSLPGLRHSVPAILILG
jgi:hypothetical protein